MKRYYIKEVIFLTVGEKIKELRLEKGLTQEELGEILGVKKAAIQKYESGQVQNLKQTTIKKLCETFNKYPAYFIFDKYDTKLEKRLNYETKFIEAIEAQYGKDAVSILEVIVDLDDYYLKKVIEYAEDMFFIQSVKNKDNL